MPLRLNYTVPLITCLLRRIQVYPEALFGSCAAQYNAFL